MRYFCWKFDTDLICIRPYKTNFFIIWHYTQEKCKKLTMDDKWFILPNESSSKLFYRLTAGNRNKSSTEISLVISLQK